jgi:hypothetical protein
LLLRKGGIAENTGEFALEHKNFWLLPTYSHQHRQGIREEALPWLEQVEAEKPPADTIHLSHWAEVTGIYRVHELIPALMIAHLHFWSEDTVRQRFDYREPGINVLTVRVYRAPAPIAIADTTDYQGCRSWVELEEALPTQSSSPVLSDKDYHDLQRSLDMLLTPTALA